MPPSSRPSYPRWLVALLIYLQGRFPVAAAWHLSFPGGSSVSFQDGILRIGQATDEESRCPMPPADAEILSSMLDCIQVKDTGNPMKGFGAFCTMHSVPKHAFLGFYTGKRIVRDLDNLDFQLASDDTNTGEYLMSLDGGVSFLDGWERAQDRSIFSPVHMNHKDKEDKGCNCFRVLEKEKVAFFTHREIQVGEELCFDYGRNYWRGRESDKV